MAPLATADIHEKIVLGLPAPLKLAGVVVEDGDCFMKPGYITTPFDLQQFCNDGKLLFFGFCIRLVF